MNERMIAITEQMLQTRNDDIRQLHRVLLEALNDLIRARNKADRDEGAFYDANLRATENRLRSEVERLEAKYDAMDW